MNKKKILFIIVLIILIIIILFGCILITRKSSNKSMISYYINNNKVSSIPTDKSKYLFDTERSGCSNGARVSWNYNTWSPTISNLKKKSSCKLYFTKTEIDDYESAIKKYKVVGNLIHNDCGVYFDGKSYIDLGLRNYDFGSNVTEVMKVSYDDMDTNTNPSVEIFNNFESAGFGFRLFPKGKVLDFMACVGDYHDKNGYTYTSHKNLDLKQGTIYWLVGTYDGKTLNMYLNGNLIGIASASGKIISSSAPFVVGGNYSLKYNDITSSTSGKTTVYQAAVYTRTLSDNEIKSIYDNDKIIDDPSGVVMLNFE